MERPVALIFLATVQGEEKTEAPDRCKNPHIFSYLNLARSALSSQVTRIIMGSTIQISIGLKPKDTTAQACLCEEQR